MYDMEAHLDALVKTVYVQKAAELQDPNRAAGNGGIKTGEADAYVAYKAAEAERLKRERLKRKWMREGEKNRKKTESKGGTGETGGIGGAGGTQHGEQSENDKDEEEDEDDDDKDPNPHPGCMFMYRDATTNVPVIVPTPAKTTTKNPQRRSSIREALLAPQADPTWTPRFPGEWGSASRVQKKPWVGAQAACTHEVYHARSNGEHWVARDHAERERQLGEWLAKRAALREDEDKDEDEVDEATAAKAAAAADAAAQRAEPGVDFPLAEGLSATYAAHREFATYGRVVLPDLKAELEGQHKLVREKMKVAQQTKDDMNALRLHYDREVKDKARWDHEGAIAELKREQRKLEVLQVDYIGITKLPFPAGPSRPEKLVRGLGTAQPTFAGSDEDLASVGFAVPIVKTTKPRPKLTDLWMPASKTHLERHYEDSGSGTSSDATNIPTLAHILQQTGVGHIGHRQGSFKVTVRSACQDEEDTETPRPEAKVAVWTPKEEEKSDPIEDCRAHAIGRIDECYLNAGRFALARGRDQCNMIERDRPSKRIPRAIGGFFVAKYKTFRKKFDLT